MKNTVSVGTNRTGIGTSPIDSKEMIEGARRVVPAPGDGEGLHEVRKAYGKGAAPVGTVPPPSTMKGVATVAMEAIKGNKPTVFIDKLGERLAFERTGTRLYESLIAKFDVAGTWKGGPTREELVQFHDEERKHFTMLAHVIAALGADPTAMTPCADVTAVESLGLMQVLTDPRTTLPQCLHAILIAELADNDAWTMLAALARELGHEELGKQFDEANAEEAVHLATVRAWLTQQVIDEATRELKQQPAE